MDSTCVVEWLRGVDEGSHKHYCDTLKRCFEDRLKPRFGLGLDELVDFQLNAVGKDRLLVVREVRDWVEDQDLTVSSKTIYFSRVRSFFYHNLADLPRIPLRFHSKRVSVAKFLRLEDLRRLVLRSNKMYRAVFMFMVSGLMGEKEVVYTNLNHSEYVMQEVFEKHSRRVKIPLPGRKRNKNRGKFFTFVSRDAVDCLRDYLKTRPFKSRFLFVNEKGVPVSEKNIRRYFFRHAVNLGLIKRFSPSCRECGGVTVRHRRNGKVFYVCRECGFEGDAVLYGTAGKVGVRYEVSAHEIRDTMRTRWVASSAKEIVVDFLMCHCVDRNEYAKLVKQPWIVEREYVKAEKWLNILSCEPEKVGRGELGFLKDENLALGKRLSELEGTVKDLRGLVLKAALSE